MNIYFIELMYIIFVDIISIQINYIFICIIYLLYLVSRKPMALFLSRWVVDITLQLSQKAKEERLHLICMPPGVAHLLQPLDDAIVNILEVMIEKKVIPCFYNKFSLLFGYLFIFI